MALVLTCEYDAGHGSTHAGTGSRWMWGSVTEGGTAAGAAGAAPALPAFDCGRGPAGWPCRDAAAGARSPSVGGSVGRGVLAGTAAPPSEPGSGPPVSVTASAGAAAEVRTDAAISFRETVAGADVETLVSTSCRLESTGA